MVKILLTAGGIPLAVDRDHRMTLVTDRRIVCQNRFIVSKRCAVDLAECRPFADRELRKHQLFT